MTGEQAQDILDRAEDTEMSEKISSSSEELTAGATGAEPAGETSAVEPDVASPEAPAAPLPTHTTVVPAGYSIAYWDGQDEGTRRHYEIDGEEAASVTTILGCLDKPALPWWGMKVGAEGVLELIKSGLLVPATHPIENHPTLAWMPGDGLSYVADVDAIVKLLTQEKLTTNHVRDKAAVRGVNAHDALERWCAIGEPPDPNDYPLEERGYVQGLLNFINDTQGNFQPDEQEIVVGSKEHLFAGRYDLRAHTTGEIRLVTSAYTTKGEIRKRGPKYTTVPAGIKILCDAKTSKGIYGSHLLQLEGYEGASVECGYEPTDARAVIHLTRDGLYEFKRARASYEDFLAILATYHALARVEEALKT